MNNRKELITHENSQKNVDPLNLAGSQMLLPTSDQGENLQPSNVPLYPEECFWQLTEKRKH